MDFDFEAYEDFISESHLEVIGDLSEEAHLENIDHYESALSMLLDQIREFKLTGHYTKALVWCSFLKTVDRKITNHYQLLHLSKKESSEPVV